MFALAAHADEREAHIREVEHHGADLPDGSYGRHNRQAIAARETRVATRLRAIEHAYQAAAGHDTAFDAAPTRPDTPSTRAMRPTRRSSSSSASQPAALPPEPAHSRPDRHDPPVRSFPVRAPSLMSAAAASCQEHHGGPALDRDMRIWQSAERPPWRAVDSHPRRVTDEHSRGLAEKAE